MQEKSCLRRMMRAKIKERDPLEQEQGSRQICGRLNAWFDEQEPVHRRVAVFLAGPQEPNLDEFAQALQKRGVEVYAPRLTQECAPFTRIAPDWSNVGRNSAGWREPRAVANNASLPAVEMDLIFLPGLAFDLKGNRLGQGGGWYDRALEGLSPRVSCVGIGFDFQIIDSIPHEPHDHTMSHIVSEKRIAYVRSS